MNGADGQALPRLSASDYFVQTWGVLVAAYRELNARKLFWVALVLNGLVIAAMAAVGVDEKGVSVFGFDLPIPLVNTTTYPDGKLYKFIFVGLGVGVWLAWLSTILALLSTASMFPDLASAYAALNAGQVDGVVIDTPINLGQASQSNGELEVVGQFVTGEEYGAIYGKDNGKKAIFDPILQGFLDDGTINGLIAKYLGGDPSTVPVIDIPAA